jgi:uncharacterized membrane protein
MKSMGYIKYKIYNLKKFKKIDFWATVWATVFICWASLRQATANEISPNTKKPVLSGLVGEMAI